MFMSMEWYVYATSITGQLTHAVYLKGETLLDTLTTEDAELLRDGKIEFGLSDKIPPLGREIISQCIKIDPNKRAKLQNIEEKLTLNTFFASLKYETKKEYVGVVEMGWQPHGWSVDEVIEWLKKQSAPLPNYEGPFRDHCIDGNALMTLSFDQWRDVIFPVGIRFLFH